MDELWFQSEKFSEDSEALIHGQKSLSYEEIGNLSNLLSLRISKNFNDTKPRHVALLASPGFDFVIGLMAIWKAGGVAVPLCHFHPEHELEYFIKDAECDLLLANNKLFEIALNISIKTGAKAWNISEQSPILDSSSSIQQKIKINPEDGALILYTSGTTGKPKGVFHTHQSIEATIQNLCEAWEWNCHDTILHFLPLHHTHGLVNKLLCSLYSGATCLFMDRFNADEVWSHIESGNITCLMGVPSVYHQLIQTHRSFNEHRKSNIKTRLSNIRLQVSGSAALPIATLNEWKQIGCYTLLERYGMTEIGMALSNSYNGLRHPGTVGELLPGVSAQVVDEQMQKVKENESGELLIKGNGVFSKYWKKPEETKNAFHNGWFKTGDIVTEKDGIFTILGRISSDILKVSGYKISALEIEQVIKEFSGISEVSIIGILDALKGQSIVAVMVKENIDLDLTVLTKFLTKKLAPYKIPDGYVIMSEIPKNAMGKVNKKVLATNLNLKNMIISG